MLKVGGTKVTPIQKKRQDITILQLIIQWMQYFRTSVVEKKEGTPANECVIY